MRVQYGTTPPVRPLDPIDPTIGDRSSGTSSSKALATSGQSAPSDGSSDEVSSVYQVRRGDTLGSIAQRFGVSVRQLRAWNDLNGSRIYPGQRLQIEQ